MIVYALLKKEKTRKKTFRWWGCGCLAHLSPPLKHLHFPNLIQQHNYFYNHKYFQDSSKVFPLPPDVPFGKCKIGTSDLDAIQADVHALGHS